jgi:long-chain acyl-CoA synthetase
MFHVSGGHSGMVLGWVTGQHQVLTEGRVTAEKVMAAIEEHRITFWPSVPTLVWRVCHHPDRERYDLASITRVAFGGAPASPDLHEQAQATFPNLTVNVGTGWGLTETTSAVTSNTGPGYVARPTSVGQPFPIVELKVVDDDGRPVANGTDGEVLVRGCQVTPGYWNDPEATSAAIDPAGWFRTGDIGHLDDDGFLYLTDRKKDVILRGGENVYSTEIENRLLEHPAVADAAVIGVPHVELGEEVKAVVQVADDTDPSPAELAVWVADTLADFKVPSKWELRERPLPRNASGKLLKQELRARRSPS